MKNKRIKKEVKKIKKEVKKEIWFNIPNSITLLRLIFIFIFIFILFSDFSKLSLIIVFAIAAISDWFDGQFARKFGQTTVIGARMDQVIDRVFTISIVVVLIIYWAINNLLGEYLILLFLVTSREIVATPGFLIALIRGKDSYHVKYIGKLTTFIQGFALGAIILGVSWAIYLVIPVCIVGIISGFDYVKYSLS